MGFAQSQLEVFEDIRGMWKCGEAIEPRPARVSASLRVSDQERPVSSESLLPTHEFSNTPARSPFMNHCSHLCGKTILVSRCASYWQSRHHSIPSSWWPVRISFWPETPSLVRTQDHLHLDCTADGKGDNRGPWRRVEMTQSEKPKHLVFCRLQPSRLDKPNYLTSEAQLWFTLLCGFSEKTRQTKIG